MRWERNPPCLILQWLDIGYLFEHQAQFPDDDARISPSNYSLGDFQEEIVGQLCAFLWL